MACDISTRETCFRSERHYLSVSVSLKDVEDGSNVLDVMHPSP